MGQSNSSQKIFFIEDKESFFFLENAFKKDDVTTIKSFYDKFRSVNYIVSYGQHQSFLYLACYHKAKNIFYFLIEKDVNVDYINNSGELALHAAVRSGDLNFVKILIEKGKFDSKNVCNNIGLDPFMIACMENKKDIAEYLYDCKCGYTVDINKKESVFSMSAVELAVFYGCKDIIEFFERRIFLKKEFW